MLDKPEAGWSEITIGEWHDRCSYIDDVPNELLDAVIRYMESGNPQAVELDAEGWNYIIVFNEWETHVISEKYDEKFTYYSEEIQIKDVISELIADIRRDIDAWSGDWRYEDVTPEEIAERKVKLLEKCDKAEATLGRYSFLGFVSQKKI